MNHKILIDPSHGGEDSGMVRGEYKAKNLNLELAGYLHERLNDFNIPNQLIRENDETISYEERIKYVKELIKSDKEFILLILDVEADKSEVFYSLKENGILANLMAKELSELTSDYKPAVQKRLPIYPEADYHYLIRETSTLNPIVISYKLDINNTKEKLKSYAEKMLMAITKYLDIDYYKEIKPGYYKVKKGDTLWSIAKKFNLSLAELKKKNNMTKNIITIGDTIKIEDITEELEEEIRIEEPIKEKNKEEILHQVIVGDTLYTIANKYNKLPEKIRNTNNLLSNEISVGTVLLIPSD